MTRIASHRGGTLEFGDSTPLGFMNTARMMLDEVEFDVHPTMDGAIMVHHDATLDRTTDRTGAIATLSEAAVRAAVIDYSAGSHPISLAELCAIYADSAVAFRCEIKPGDDGLAYQDLVPRVIDVLQKTGMLDRTTLSSFLVETLDELADATDRPLLWLVSPPVLRQLGHQAIIEVALAHGIPEIGVHIDFADARLMDAVQSAGLDFGCWAAHTAEQIDKAFALGVKVFTTDRPSLAMAIRDRKQSA
ncbi:glycerophosphodiester phosphodiesterase family protein [uncultured Devosia sp.]|uniref:glycerophosphodiester phosphodiesterase family protein n=1 Tax=uncultured Devosia sp. TaxID=211434 RepID=UPI0035CA4C4C